MPARPELVEGSRAFVTHLGNTITATNGGTGEYITENCSCSSTIIY